MLKISLEILKLPVKKSQFSKEFLTKEITLIFESISNSKQFVTHYMKQLEQKHKGLKNGKFESL